MNKKSLMQTLPVCLGEADNQGVTQKILGSSKHRVFAGIAVHSPPVLSSTQHPATTVDGCFSLAPSAAGERPDVAHDSRKRVGCDEKAPPDLRTAPESVSPAAPVANPRRRAGDLGVPGAKSGRRAGDSGVAVDKSSRGLEMRNPRQQALTGRPAPRSFALLGSGWKPMGRCGAARRWFICLPRSWRRLRLLMAHAGQVVSPAQLKHELWGDVHVTADSVPKCLSSLRARLEPDACIQTVYKRGYRFSAEIKRQSAAPAEKLLRLAILPFATGFSVPEHLGPAIAEETIVSLTSARSRRLRCWPGIRSSIWRTRSHRPADWQGAEGRPGADRNSAGILLVITGCGQR